MLVPYLVVLTQYFCCAQVYYIDATFAMGHVVIRMKRNVVGDESPYVTLFRCIQNMNPVHPYNTCYTGGEPVLLFMSSYKHPLYNSCYRRSTSVFSSLVNLSSLCVCLCVCVMAACVPVVGYGWQLLVAGKKENASSRCEGLKCTFPSGIVKLEVGDHLELLIPRSTANVSLDGDSTFLGAVKLA